MSEQENIKTFSQEELNSIVSDRLNKEKGKYEQQISELTGKTEAYEQQIASFTSQLEELKSKATTYETEIQERDTKLRDYETKSVKLRVAYEVGIPYELADRLSGETEEDIKKDAEKIKGFMGQSKAMPMKSTEETLDESSLDSAFRQMAKSIAK